MKWLAGLFKGKNPIDSIFEGIDKLSTSAEEKELLRHQALRIEIEKEQQKLEEKKLAMSDRESARSMFKQDSWLQKVFAIVYLVAYIFLSWYIIDLIATGALKDLTTFEAGFIGSIWGGMTAKLNTVTDFLFGGSQGEQESKSREDFKQMAEKDREKGREVAGNK